MRSSLTQFERDRIIFLHERGFSSSQIKEELKFAKSTITYTIRRFKETGSVFDRHRSGRPSISDERDDRKLIRLSKKFRKASSTLLASNWALSSGLKASASTVRRRMAHEKYNPDCILQRTKQGSGSIGIWACMTSEGIGSFHIFDGRLNAHRYVEILNSKLEPVLNKFREKGKG